VVRHHTVRRAGPAWARTRTARQHLLRARAIRHRSGPRETGAAPQEPDRASTSAHDARLTASVAG